MVNLFGNGSRKKIRIRIILKNKNVLRLIISISVSVSSKQVSNYQVSFQMHYLVKALNSRLPFGLKQQPSNCRATCDCCAQTLAQRNTICNCHCTLLEDIHFHTLVLLVFVWYVFELIFFLI